MSAWCFVHEELHPVSQFIAGVCSNEPEDLESDEYSDGEDSNPIPFHANPIPVQETKECSSQIKPESSSDLSQTFLLPSQPVPSPSINSMVIPSTTLTKPESDTNPMASTSLPPFTTATVSSAVPLKLLRFKVPVRERGRFTNPSQSL